MRLDLYVASQLSDLSRAASSKLIDASKVKINGVAQTKAGYKLKLEDIVDIDYQPFEEGQLEQIELPVIYEDGDCVVANKPVGLLTHSKGAFNPEPTVATWLSSRVTGLNGDRAGIVHRLDRLTSGVIICAKNDEAMRWLQKQFSSRKVKKTYIAIVQGHLENDEAIIDMPIERNPKKPQTFRTGINGKASKTAYKILTSNNRYSLLELKPTTGRTHQLRVHLSQIGHPIVGDTLYGGPTGDRMYLHALSLEITLLTRERITFTAKLPAHFKDILR
jgi:23S rRNA pseudouridine1911/1915/1917 synthase